MWTDEKAFCDIHGEYLQKRFQLREGGKILRSKCPTCDHERNAAHEKKALEIHQREKDGKIKKLLGEAGIPKRFAGRNFENYRAESDDQKKALKVASYFASNFEQFLSNGASLIFCGKPGTGKTHLAAAIANSVCEQGRSSLFLSVLKATMMIKDSWRKDSDARESDVYKTLTSPDLLILDEVGVQFGSEAEKLILFKILNDRYEQMLPCILISNLLPSELSGFLGERILDRLREGGGSRITFNWDSYRQRVLADDALPKANVTPVAW